ncbi:TetR/AcrR family transcriptional regulator [Phenylobacterium sp.]|uniref:TetR/AcrR family transcriptional regulator n=1 Tax=Phenylobacterium sp. TaxID=1871053 RepID=UPI0035678292
MASRRDDLEAADGSTAAKLCAAAMDEFNAHGFAGTDTNRIARRAGFAPQTFYRWYRDKTEIFVAAYRAWEDAEKDVLGSLLARDAPVEALVEAGIAHHRRYLMFRRSLRQLSLENPAVRRARAESRLRQIDQIHTWTGLAADTGTVAVRLLQLERLSDAVAEGELADMGLSEDEARAALGRIVASLRDTA